MKHTKADSESRRKFLKTGAAAGAGAAVASLLPETVAAAVESDREEEQRPKKGYRLTRHVIDYYKTTTL